jgi:hypothetical protein
VAAAAASVAVGAGNVQRERGGSGTALARPLAAARRADMGETEGRSCWRWLSGKDA